MATASNGTPDGKTYAFDGISTEHHGTHTVVRHAESTRARRKRQDPGQAQHWTNGQTHADHHRARKRGNKRSGNTRLSPCCRVGTLLATMCWLLLEAPECRGTLSSSEAVIVTSYSCWKLTFLVGRLIGVCSLLTSMQNLGSQPVFESARPDGQRAELHKV